MQLSVEKKDIFRSDKFKENNFSIQASLQAFKVLSSDLYSDKFVAIVRELATNASDAHVIAGINDRPIKVVCPNAVSPTFYVKDWGLGIDPEEFEKIYTTYFYSTKTESNDQIGCFGLGSKSPFAYADHFIVENCYSGRKYIYQCFKNEFGEPAVALLGDTETDDTGIKVSFAVKPVDAMNFEDACKEVLKWFDVTPESNVQIEKIKFDAPAILFKTKLGVANFAEHKVIMGQVAYDIDQKYFKDIFGYNSIAVNVPLGMADITPSRQSIRYTPRTVANLEILKEEIRSYFSSKLEEIKNDNSLSSFEKYKKACEIIDKSGLDNRFLEVVDTSYGSGSFSYISGQYADSMPSFRYYEKDTWRKKLDSYKHGYIKKNTKILVSDGKRAILRKVESIIDGGEVILVNEQDLKKILDLGLNANDSNIIYAKDIKLESLQRQSNASNKTNCSKVDTGRYGSFKKKGVFLPKTVNDGFYITEEEFESAKNWGMRSLRQILKEFRGEVYVFTSRQFEYLKISRRNFKHLMEHYKEMVENNRERVVKILVTSSISSDRAFRLMSQCSERVSDNSSLKNFVQKYSDNVDNQDAAILELASNVMEDYDVELYNSISKEYTSLTAEFSADLEKIWEKYPLAKFVVDKPPTDDIINSVVSYVDLVDSK